MPPLSTPSDRVENSDTRSSPATGNSSFKILSSTTFPTDYTVRFEGPNRYFWINIKANSASLLISIRLRFEWIDWEILETRRTTCRKAQGWIGRHGSSEMKTWKKKKMNGDIIATTTGDLLVAFQFAETSGTFSSRTWWLIQARVGSYYPELWLKAGIIKNLSWYLTCTYFDSSSEWYRYIHDVVRVDLDSLN